MICFLEALNYHFHYLQMVELITHLQKVDKSSRLYFSSEPVRG